MMKPQNRDEADNASIHNEILYNEFVRKMIRDDPLRSTTTKNDGYRSTTTENGGFQSTTTENDGLLSNTTENDVFRSNTTENNGFRSITTLNGLRLDELISTLIKMSQCFSVLIDF